MISLLKFAPLPKESSPTFLHSPYHSLRQEKHGHAIYGGIGQARVNEDDSPSNGERTTLPYFKLLS
jgi:hypothetical protein